MVAKRFYLWVLVVLFAFLLVVPTALSGGKSKRAQQKEIAARIVSEIAGVKAKDLVIVRGNARDFDLVEDLMLEVWKKGAMPLQMVGRETLYKRYFDEVPAERDGDSRDFDLKLAEAQNVEIVIGRQDNPGMLKKVPPERLAKVKETYMPIWKLQNQRGVRRVYLGNGMYPTKATAKQYGISQKHLDKLFWAGLNVDYQKLQATGAKLSGILEGGKQVHITNKNGTDLKFGIEKRPVVVSDGIISEEDVKKGGPSTVVWLPAGEVMLTPVPGTAEGQVVITRLPYSDGEIRKMVMIFKAGKLESVDAKKTAAFKRFKEFYDKAPEGKNAFSFVNFGINPNVKIPKKSKLVTWVPAGMVSFGIGGNSFIGGEIDIPFGFSGFLPGSTVKVDDQVVIEKGQLKI